MQDAGLSGALDPDVLEWAAREERVLLTHDLDTLIGCAWARVRAGLPMPCVVAVRQGMATGRAIEELELFAGASEAGESPTDAGPSARRHERGAGAWASIVDEGRRPRLFGASPLPFVTGLGTLDRQPPGGRMSYG